MKQLLNLLLRNSLKLRKPRQLPDYSDKRTGNGNPVNGIKVLINWSDDENLFAY